MRIGVIQYMVYPQVAGGRGPILESLREFCADDYFQEIEVTEMKNTSVRAEARGYLQGKGRGVSFCAQPVLLRNKLNLSEADTEERTKDLDEVKRIMDQAVEWKASCFQVCSGPDPRPEERDDAKVRLVGSLKEICEASRTRNGPAVLLEPMDRQPFGKRRLIGPTAEAVEVARVVAPYYPRFGLTLDLSHLPLLSEPAVEAVTKAADYLKHVHIGNCVIRDPKHPAYGDEHPPIGIREGEIGTEQLAAFLKGLLEVGYLREGGRNTVSFSVKPLKRQSVGDLLASCKKTLAAAWQMI